MLEKNAYMLHKLLLIHLLFIRASKVHGWNETNSTVAVHHERIAFYTVQMLIFNASNSPLIPPVSRSLQAQIHISVSRDAKPRSHRQCSPNIISAAATTKLILTKAKGNFLSQINPSFRVVGFSNLPKANNCSWADFVLATIWWAITGLLNRQKHCNTSGSFFSPICQQKS